MPGGCCGCCCPPDPDAEGLLSPRDRKSSEGHRLPVKRGCTDCFCLLLFALTVAGAGIVAKAAFRVGDPDRLVHGVDYTGALCGRGTRADTPYIYYPRLAEDLRAHEDMLSSAPWAIPLYGVCVPECPKQGAQVLDYGCERRHSKCRWRENPLISWYTEESNSWHVNVDTTPMLNRCMPTLREAEDSVRLCAYPDCEAAHKACFVEQFPSARYWRPAEDEVANCEQLVTVSTHRTIASRGSALELEFIGGFFGGFLGALSDVYLGTLELVVFGVLCSLVLNFALMFILRHFVRLLFYSTVIFLVLALALVDVIAFAKAGRLQIPALTEQVITGLESTLASSASSTSLSPSQLAAADAAVDSVSAFATRLAGHAVFTSATDEQAEQWLTGGYVAVGVTIGVIVFVVLLWGKVENALEICREATKAVFDNKALIVLPIISSAFSICVMASFVLTVVYILTPDPSLITRQIDVITHSLTESTVQLTNKAADVAIDLSSAAIDQANELAEQAMHERLIDVQLHDIEIDGGAWANYNVTGTIDPAYVASSALALELLTALWVLLFVDAVVYCTIAGAITYWYQEREGKGVMPALGRVLRYHLGSMALGSSTIALTSLFRYIFMYVDTMAKANRENALVRVATKCLMCCLWCLETCIKYLTKFSYVFIAAEGFSFCAAAVKTFTLVSKHPLQMLTNEATLGVLSLLLTMLTPLGCAILAYFSVLHEWRNTVLGLSLGDALDSVGVASAGGVAAVDNMMASTVAGLPDWTTTGPPDALTVAVATLFVSFWITQMFRMVYAATVDTLFVCMFRDDDFLAGKYASTSGSAGPSSGPSTPAGDRLVGR